MNELERIQQLEKENKELKKFNKSYKQLLLESKKENHSLKESINGLLDVAYMILLHDISDTAKKNIQIRIDTAESLISDFIKDKK